MIKSVKIYENSLKIGVIPLRKLALIDIEIDDGYEETIKATIPYYQSSGTNNGKIKGQWYPILGILKKKEPIYKGIEYFIKKSCKDFNSLTEGWLIKSPFFVNFQGYTKNKGEQPFGYGNHEFTKYLKRIGEKIKYLYEKNNYDFYPNLDLEFNNKIVNQEYINELVQYMCVGDLLN